MADGEYGYYARQTTRTRSFIGDADGTILRKTDNGNVQNLYYAGDKAIGSVSGTASSPVADFDFNCAPASDTYPAVSPGNYTVAAGDTLRGIAYKAYGDSKLWYLIADANGLMTDGDMHLGQALKIPNRITNVHNDFQTNKVYNAAEIIGDIELRLKGAEGIARAFFCTLVGKRIVMLHSFIKKSNRTPTREREVAETRMKEIKRAIP